MRCHIPLFDWVQKWVYNGAPRTLKGPKIEINIINFLFFPTPSFFFQKYLSNEVSHTLTWINTKMGIKWGPEDPKRVRNWYQYHGFPLLSTHCFSFSNTFQMKCHRPLFQWVKKWVYNGALRTLKGSKNDINIINFIFSPTPSFFFQKYPSNEVLHAFVYVNQKNAYKMGPRGP